MPRINDFIELVLLSVKKEALSKLVFSRPKTSDIKKVSARLCIHRSQRLLALEYSLPGNTVSHKNLREDGIEEELLSLINEYSQANLITKMGDSEWKISNSGKEALLGADKLKRRLLESEASSECALPSLDVKKNYILSGSESFLIELGISDKNGRVHDKRQGKFRQINRFLEYIEDIYPSLEEKDELLIYDLCCGKSYLSFAVYHYFTKIKGKRVRLLGIDLKADCIEWCGRVARAIGFSGMSFVCDDIKNTPSDKKPDMVISLHACDVATDIVINRAIELGAGVILSTPCCHKYLNGKVKAEGLKFITRHPHLSNKLCEAITDALRALRLEANGYEVSTPELTDPSDTPKNTLIRAIYKNKEATEKRQEYENALSFILGENKDTYLKGF